VCIYINYKMPTVPPLDIELGDVTEHNLQQLKTLNMVALPVRYSDKFYKELLANSPPEYLKYGGNIYVYRY
jgi:N-alpha-acetyltransferase 50